MEPTSAPYVCSGDAELDYSNTTVPSFLLYDGTDAIILTIVNPCLFALGLLGNFAFLFVMIRVRRMWTVTNIYLINMAVADTTFLTIAVQVKLVNYLSSPVSNDKSAFGHVGTVLTLLLLDISYFASVFIITLVSMEKYYAICRPVQHRLVAGKKRTARLLVGAWLLAMSFALVLLPSWAVYKTICTKWPPTKEYEHFPDSIGITESIAEWYVHFHNLMQTVPFFLALFVNLIFYAKIILRLSSRMSNAVSQAPAEESARCARRQRVRNQVARMLIVNGVVFFVCLAPFQITSFALTISIFTGNSVLTSEQVDKLLWAGRIFTYINPIVNPIIYNLTNLRYRQAFYEAYCGKRRADNKKAAANEQEETISTVTV